jgi:DNA polymerase/3'-5' exonuclease PolX
MNDKLISLLNSLRQTDNIYRARAFEIACNELSKLKYTISKKTLDQFHDDVKQKRIKHIGTGILSRIEEYCDTQTIEEAELLIHKATYLKQLMQIKGVGKQLANTWIAQHIYTLADVKRTYARNQITLTSAQQCGILYYKSLNERIPRDEVTGYTSYLRSCFDKLAHFDVVGSYRRGLPTCGDVDILIVLRGCKVADIIDSIQQQYFIEFISKGNERITYLYEWAGKVRQCDILISAKSEYVAALTYFTGSREFCIMLRNQARRLGYRLNQKGLYYNGVALLLKSEQELFKKLQLDYVQPENRI